MKKFIVQKPDLDTCLSILLAGGHPCSPIKVVSRGAGKEALDDISVICIEAGGSGRIDLNNFDHHDPVQYYPPACRQVYNCFKVDNPYLCRLVDYVCMVDESVCIHPAIAFPSLSAVFSGMRMAVAEPSRQVVSGVKLLEEFIRCGYDPFVQSPVRDSWRTYILAKKENGEQLSGDLKNTVFMTSTAGQKVGFLETTAIGGTQALYNAGCEIAVLFNPAYGYARIGKYTIAGNRLNVSRLLPALLKLEKGWGGRESIIGSPHSGTKIKKKTIINQVLKWL